jgi:site-specific DNA-methyltransferase (adenine-specific)
MIEILNEDCLTGMRRKFTDNSVDCIVTSPPYNLGIAYKHYNDHIARQEYLHWIADVSYEMYRVLSDSGSLFLNLGSKPTDPWVAYDVIDVFRRNFQLQNQFIWVKSIAIDSKGSYGHYKPLNSPRFVNDCFEFIFHLTKDGNVPIDRLSIGVPYSDKTNVKRWNGVKSDIRCRGNVWYINYPTTQKRKSHPATFPPTLAKRCFMLHGVEQIKVSLDPFCGVGNSALAAKELGIDFVGFELDKTYCDEAISLIGG